ncbi:MAG: PKD domain-containing protein, partial [Bacteroidota bacterium]
SVTGLTPGESVYVRIAGLNAAAVPVGRIQVSFANYLIWTPTNGDDWSLPENWQQGDATSLTIPNASRSILTPAGSIKPRLTANSNVNGVNLQAPPPFYGSQGIDLNGFTLNVKGSWNVGPVANATANLNCSGLVEFNSNSATPQTITGRTNFGNLNINNTVGGVQANNLTGVNCVLTSVAGTFNANGNLVLRSTTANSAALVAPSIGTITGNVTVERKIGPTSGYHYLSAPVSGAFVNNTVTGWRDDFTIIATNDGQIFIPGNVYTTLATVWEYNEPNTNPNPDYGWIGATGTTDAITPLKGFACVVPANVTVDVVGPLNNNIIPGGYTITRQTDGTNLIGNPYPSPISWNAFRGLASNTTALSTSGYKAFITTGGYAGAYGTWNGTVGSPASVTDKIASSQGFMVECLQPTATINALNTARLTTAADVSGQFFGYNSVPDLMRIEVQGNGFANETAIYFDASSTDAYNNSHDSKTLFAPTPGIPTIYSAVENTKLAINVMGNLNANKVVPMGVKIQTAGTYNIIATDMTSFAPSVIAYLEDTQAGTMTNLRTNPSYSVTLAEGEINDRFYIHFHPAVELNAVNETCAGNDGKLVINYPTSNTVNIVVKDANGNVVAAQNNVTGVVTVNNLVAGNYVAEMTFGVAPNTYTATDYFTVAGGNAVFANLSASANTVDMAANTTVQFTATAQGATGFNWNFGDGTIIINGPANVSHTFAQAGTYNVTFEASNGICNAVATTTVEVTNATGLTAIASSNLQVVGVGSRVTVRFGSKMEGTGNIEVINMLGEVVAHLDNVAMKGTREIDMTNIAAGQYLVRITNNNSLFTEKVYLSRQ